MAKKVLPFDQAQNIWEGIIREGKEIRLELDLEIHKRMLNLIHIGPFYYYIFDIQTSCLSFVSTSVYEVLGYTLEEFTLSFFFSNVIHPDDVQYYVNFENKVVQFFSTLTVENIFKYKVQYEFRVRKKSGEYIRVLQQVVTLETTPEGGVNKSLGIHTDISDIKSDGTPSLSIIGMDGEPSYLNIEVENVFVPTKSLLSDREKEVLFHIIHGKHSNEISEMMGLSKHTVLNHRRKILAKTNASSTSELVLKTIQEGWV
ncbi:MAG: LuxR C-terminal-related transcriptional regulator [Paludibacter sp.]